MKCTAVYITKALSLKPNKNLAGSCVNEHKTHKHTLQGLEEEGRSPPPPPWHYRDPHYSREWVQEDMVGRACAQSPAGGGAVLYWDFLHQSVSSLLVTLWYCMLYKLTTIKSDQRRLQGGFVERYLQRNGDRRFSGKIHPLRWTNQICRCSISIHTSCHLLKLPGL